MSLLVTIFPSRKVIEHFLQVRRQARGEFHSAAVARVLERQACRVQERALKMRNRANVTGDATMHSAVQRIADDRMTDGAEMYPDLMRAAGVNGDVTESQTRQMQRARNSGHRLARAARPCGHLLTVHRIAADRRIDSSSSLNHTPHQCDVFLFHFAIVELA